MQDNSRTWYLYSLGLYLKITVYWAVSDTASGVHDTFQLYTGILYALATPFWVDVIRFTYLMAKYCI